jgi:hypothetical protein
MAKVLDAKVKSQQQTNPEELNQKEVNSGYHTG